ncbi:LytR/AlgR family response regulator transcription factor [Eupransor demetentiae]|uniref:LytR/AlgR family (LytT) n=1 Tax=Eupransor demetentiae TaxID=3109584 RepID=A0ABP0ET54_9LACO|nr:DNA-binding response regulator [Lactobacillaceae bacterium LMG 33000]
MTYYLLEDGKTYQRKIKKILPGTKAYGSPRELIAALDQDEYGHKIIILDLEIKGIRQAGFRTAQHIRRQDPHAQIIIVTSHTEMSFLCFQYQIGVIDFISKNDEEQAFQSRLQRAVQTAKDNISRIEEITEIPVRFPNGSQFIKGDLNQVDYISSEKGTHYLEIHTRSNTIKVRANLKDISAIHKNLLQIHAAYCINISQIESYRAGTQTLTLKNGTNLPVSRRFIKAIRQLA